MGFPILKLPVVALKVLLDFLCIVDLVSLSLLSKRAEWFLKSCGKKDVSFFDLDCFEICTIEIPRLFLLEVARRGFPWPAEVLVSISDKAYVSINQKKNEYSCFSASIYVDSHKNMQGDETHLSFGETRIPFNVVKNKELGRMTISYWDTKVSGLISLLKYFHQDLNIPFTCLSIGGENGSKDFSKTIREFVKHVNSTGITLEDVKICNELSDENFKFLLENVSVTGTFTSSIKSRKKFKFTGKIQAESILINNAHWFTIENLMASVENKEIVVRDSKLTHCEVRLFLESWKSGQFQNLRKVRLETDKQDAFFVTDGFERRSAYLYGPGMGTALSRGIVGNGNAYGVVTKQDRSEMFEMSVRFDT